MPPRDPRSRRPRRGIRHSLRRAGIILFALSLLGLRLFVLPPVDRLGGSDAVVVLAGSPATRLPLAMELAAGGPGILVVSAAGGERNAPARALCDPAAVTTLSVICFTPHPSDTRGEARAIGRLVQEQHWHRITVVTSTYHVARAGLLVRRCTDAEIVMADATPEVSWWGWTRLVAHEIGGLVEASVRRSC